MKPLEIKETAHIRAMEYFEKEHCLALNAQRRETQSFWKKPSNTIAKSTRNPVVRKTKTGFIHR